MKKTVEYTELCRYDDALKYDVDIEVLSDKFILGNKGENLRFAVSDYGFRRLLKDDIDGLIDIKETSLLIQAFHYPEITDKDIIDELDSRRNMLIRMIENNIPLNPKI